MRQLLPLSTIMPLKSDLFRSLIYLLVHHHHHHHRPITAAVRRFPPTLSVFKFIGTRAVPPVLHAACDLISNLTSKLFLSPLTVHWEVAPSQFLVRKDFEAFRRCAILHAKRAPLAFHFIRCASCEPPRPFLFVYATVLITTSDFNQAEKVSGT